MVVEVDDVEVEGAKLRRRLEEDEEDTAGIDDDWL